MQLSSNIERMNETSFVIIILRYCHITFAGIPLSLCRRFLWCSVDITEDVG